MSKTEQAIARLSALNTLKSRGSNKADAIALAEASESLARKYEGAGNVEMSRTHAELARAYREIADDFPE